MNVICTTQDLETLIPEGVKIESDVIVSHFNEEAVSMMQKLRSSGDHRPLLFLASEKDSAVLAEVKNCCGGGILPPFTPERMREALERVSQMKHDSHCE